MLRVFPGSSHRRVIAPSPIDWLHLHGQYRRMTRAIRRGDLSEAKLAFDRIGHEQSGDQQLSVDAQLAFEALGEAIDSGDIEAMTDSLGLLRLVLESGRDERLRSQPCPTYADDERPVETLRSGVVPTYAAGVGDELPETATVFDIEVSAQPSSITRR